MPVDPGVTWLSIIDWLGALSTASRLKSTCR